MSAAWQDALALVTVVLAFGYLFYKLALEPRLRSRRPHVAASALVRKNRPVETRRRSGGCH